MSSAYMTTELELIQEEVTMFKVGDRVSISAAGVARYGSGTTNPTGVSGTVTELRDLANILNPIVISWDSGATNTYQEEHLDLVTGLKLKVGDRVRWIGPSKEKEPEYIGVILAITKDRDYPVKVKWDNGIIGQYTLGAPIELVQPEVSLPDVAKGPIPGKYYRTRSNYKLKFIAKASSCYLYEHEDAYDGFNIYEFDGPYRYTSAYENVNDIVGEWVDEVTLPEVLIKRWAVVLSKDNDKGYSRGNIYEICDSAEDAETCLINWDDSGHEIVELTGTLPERKVTK
jgi:hypothetical protein